MGNVGAFTTIRLERPAGCVKAVLYRRARTLHLERDPQGGRSAGDRCSGGTPARTSGSAETAPRPPSAAQRPAPPPGRSAEFPAVPGRLGVTPVNIGLLHRVLDGLKRL